MAPSAEPTQEESARLALTRFLQASGPAEADRALAHVVNEVAMPIIQRVLGRKFGSGGGRRAEAEEVASQAKEQLLERLLALRADASAAGSGAPIRNLPAYVATLAYSAWARHLSRVHPGRAILGNQLRHLLEDRHGRHGFACWHGSTGERWCGLAIWQQSIPPDHGGNPRAAGRIHRLVSEPAAAAREALADRTDPASCGLEKLLHALFLWIGAPLEWHDLSVAVFQIHEADWKAEPVRAHDDPAAGVVPDSAPSPHDQVRWMEYLQWLWRQVGELPPRQRAAFLLHAHVVFEWEAAGIASVGEVAGQLGLAPGRCAELWAGLPLDDLTIAGMLGCTRQQVINLRRVARDTLGRAWQRLGADGSGLSPVISPAFSTHPIRSTLP